MTSGAARAREMKQALDFIVIGAQKAGTTTLFDHLREHSGLELPAGKEAPFFSDDARFARGMPDYLSRVFPFGDPAKLWGTVTPQYMVGGVLGRGPRSAPQQDDPPVITVPRRIRALCPDARLIAILRDPTERAFSHYRQTVLYGWEQRPFEQAIEESLRPAALEVGRERPSEPAGYVVWGEYGRILEPYFELFGTDRVLVVFTEELAHDPAALLARIYAFLGADPAKAATVDEERRARRGASTRRMAWLNPYLTQSKLARNGASRALWHAVPWRTRRKIDELFARAAVRIDLWNREPGDAAMPAEAAAALREHFQDDARRLAELIGRPPTWADEHLPEAAEREEPLPVSENPRPGAGQQ